MATLYNLEVRDEGGVILAVESDRPFGAISTGDFMSVGGSNEELMRVESIWHIVIDRNDGPGHKIVVKVTPDPG